MCLLSHLHACDEAPLDVGLNVGEERVAAPVEHNLVQHLIHLTQQQQQ
jgi:hypothetical protein